MQLTDANKVRDFWERRATKYGALAVGHVNRALDFQQRQLEARKKLIFAHCPTDLRTLDYGCGTGNYADMFEQYIGVDITAKFIEVARKRFPEKEFVLLDNIYLKDASLSFQPELFFTANVLQHNSDAVVKRLFKNVARLVGAGRSICFCLYENCYTQSGHMRGRTPIEHGNLIGSCFSLLNAAEFHHEIHGEAHAVTLVNARSKARA